MNATSPTSKLTAPLAAAHAELLFCPTIASRKRAASARVYNRPARKEKPRRNITRAQTRTRTHDDAQYPLARISLHAYQIGAEARVPAHRGAPQCRLCVKRKKGPPISDGVIPPMRACVCARARVRELMSLDTGRCVERAYASPRPAKYE